VDQYPQLLDRGLVVGHAAGEGELVADAARARDDRHGAQDNGAVEPGQDILALLAQGEAVAQLGAGEDGAGRVDAHRFRGLHGHRAELVQSHVHLVGDVAEIAPAAGGAAVVHLEVLDDALRVHLDRLGVLAADVEDRAGLGVHHVRAEAVTEDLGADVLLRKRQRDPAVTGADDIGLLQLHLHGLAHGVLRDSFVHLQMRIALHHPMQRPPVLGRYVAFRRAVLDVDDGLVVKVEQRVEGDASGLRHLLADVHDAGARDVPEEVGPAPGAALEHAGRLGVDALEHLRQGLEHARLAVPDVAGAGRAQVLELLQELFQADVELQVLHQLVYVLAGNGIAQAAAEQGEAGADMGLLLGHRGRRLVIGARVRDALAEDLHVGVHEDRLGGGRAEVDADVALHGAVLRPPQAALAGGPPPRRFCSIICRFCSIIWK
jgi:hypothetical protein